MPVTKKFIQGVTQITAANLNKTGFYNLVAREQDTPNMTLAISSGVANINGVVVKYGGGNSGTFTAPVSNARIDLLTMDTSGTLAIVQGTSAVSPVSPPYPTNKLVICEVYIRSGSTYIAQEDAGSNGYIYNDGRSISQDNVAAYTYGTGADGDVSITSGTTTLSADAHYTNLTISAGAVLQPNGWKVYVQNTLSNTGTIRNNGNAGTAGSGATAGPGGTTSASSGSLAATTAGAAGGNGATSGSKYGGGGGGGGASGGTILIVARILTNSGTIEANGGAGGAGADANNVAAAGSANGSNGGTGTSKTSVGSNGSNGGKGGDSSPNTGGTAGAGGTNTAETISYTAPPLVLTSGSIISSPLFMKLPSTSTNGLTLSTSSGAGGGGGGCLYMTAPTYDNCGGGGGGGGNGGTIVLVYSSLTAGTITATGGAYGAKGRGYDANAGTLDPTLDGANGVVGSAGKIYKVLIT